MDGTHDPLGPEALDFWLGDWDLTWGDEGRGTNRIERTAGGRVIHGARSYLGLVSIDVDGRISFEMSTLEDDVAVTGRMVWLDVTPASLRWEWQRSMDGGASWATDWAIEYRRR